MPIAPDSPTEKTSRDPDVAHGSPEIRPLRTTDDFRACVALQRLTWGDDFNDVVPAHLVKVTQRIGGIAAGAFDESGEMLGFVFGMTGVQDGALVHWSDMLAVRPSARSLGIGRLLKEYQRDQLRRLGVELIQWTFDPLVARNAHLNLMRLGARVSEYVVDMYSDSNSPLHNGFGTDRFVASWWTDESRNPVRDGEDMATEAPVVNADDDGGPVTAVSLDGGAPRLRIEIPRDIISVLGADPALARAWRESSRAAFQEAMRRGYEVQSFTRDRESDRCFYILTHSGTGEETDAVR